MGATELVFAALASVIALYVLLVNRKRQRYVGSTTFDAPLDKVWRLHDIRPGQADWVPMVQSCVWVSEADQDMLVAYSNGAELRSRVLKAEPGAYLMSEVRIRPAHSAPFGDRILQEVWLSALGSDRTQVRSELRVERAPGGNLATRLSYPWMLWFGWRLMRRRLEQEGGAPRGVRPRAVGALWQVALVAATLASFGWLMGFWVGVGLLFTLVAHEYGHVWAMRRHGHETARFYLVPFFGGVAIGSRMFRSEAEAAEIFLMGPVFGLAASAVVLTPYALMGDPFWASLAGFLAIVNGLNLAPIPPLDGGRVVQSLLRPFGDKVWYAASGLLLLAGAALAAWYRLAGLLFVVALGVWAWWGAAGPNRATRPLALGGGVAVFVAYLVLIGLHVVFALWAFQLDGPGGALEDGPSFATESDTVWIPPVVPNSFRGQDA
ncbi:metalloprotease [Methylopila henanensis]|uniref:Metalloprotease n=1 Tax=Methylopila henanensis TaxID=873516 RepID=A0ABW4K5G2_9HYPH